MSDYTTNLNLLKKNPESDGNDYFNIQTMLNDNWDKIDAVVAAKETPAGAQAKVDNLAGAGRTTQTVKSNADAITTLNQTVTTHTADNVKHITSVERSTWNGKLNAASYTAADVLAKIKTVDGAGSGLDADKFGGKALSAFLNVENTLIEDGNLAIDPSKTYYCVSSGVNVPSNTHEWFVTVQIYSNGNLHQTWRTFNTGGNEVYIRTRTNNVWGPFCRMWHSGNDGAGSGLDAALLCGIAATGFTQAGILTKAQLDNTQLPTGVYHNNGDGLTNLGAASDWFHVIHMYHGIDGFASQIVTGYTGAYQGRTFTRTANGPTWGAWAEIITGAGGHFWRNILQQPQLKDYTETIGYWQTAAGAIAFNIAAGNFFMLNPSGAATISITNPPASPHACSITVRIYQTATAYAITWPASIRWKDGVVPDLSTINTIHDLVFVSIDGGLTWQGGLAAKYAP